MMISEPLNWLCEEPRHSLIASWAELCRKTDLSGLDRRVPVLRRRSERIAGAPRRCLRMRRQPRRGGPIDLERYARRKI